MTEPAAAAAEEKKDEEVETTKGEEQLADTQVDVSHVDDTPSNLEVTAEENDVSEPAQNDETKEEESKESEASETSTVVADEPKVEKSADKDHDVSKIAAIAAGSAGAALVVGAATVGAVSLSKESENDAAVKPEAESAKAVEEPAAKDVPAVEEASPAEPEAAKATEEPAAEAAAEEPATAAEATPAQPEETAAAPKSKAVANTKPNFIVSLAKLILSPFSWLKSKLFKSKASKKATPPTEGSS
ncbi:hypothetical protein NLG97_g7496 [Lecanicillium saksenae]|uniref:Uncharacterized protein n=1 Tax=Lecanicillium saksenae TaxID=468837 RepID=A0ACC1QLM2_9HYPO|nr:hypothetical protein NLG97_g7496 [Lecanicillium saksenae]